MAVNWSSNQFRVGLLELVKAIKGNGKTTKDTPTTITITTTITTTTTATETTTITNNKTGGRKLPGPMLQPQPRVEVMLEIYQSATVATLTTMDNASLKCADEKKLDDIRVVRDFPEVFPDDMLGLPLVREIKFRIDLIPDASPVIRSPYRVSILFRRWSDKLSRLVVMDFGGSWRYSLPLIEFFHNKQLTTQAYVCTIRGSVGDRVLLKVSSWKGVVRFGKKGKLAPRYVGPFEIVERVRSVAYRLKLPQELSCVHNTFHVSNLKKCFAEPDVQVPLYEIEIDENLRFVEEPIEIVEQDVKKLKQRRIPLVKVHWNSRQGAEYT
ncbi:hypothetical protein Tco_0737266 [Tanacetum coccineum]